MAKIENSVSVFNLSSRYFHVLYYDMKYISNAPNKWLNGTTEVVRDIKHHHTEKANLSTRLSTNLSTN